MNTISAFTAPDATVIFGSVIDESMGDALRVTIVATGLGQPVLRSMPKPVIQVVRTGTDNVATELDAETNYDSPAILRRGRAERVKAMSESGIDPLDIPAFLRKQAD
jgi:cell division protein FtsZ